MVYPAAGLLVSTFIVTVIACSFFIKRMKQLQFGQQIRTDGPLAHSTKAGTPTMGGAVFILIAALAALIAAGLSPLLYTVLLVALGCGLVGFMDDYLKVAYNRSLGLRARSKLAAEAVIAIIFIILLRQLGLYSTEVVLPFVNLEIDLGLFYPLLIFLIITAASNSVNLTDGVDGLAAGIAVIVLAAYGYIAFITGKTEIALFCAALSGACAGFLVYNRNPARLFMGDVGSLALGGAFAALAVVTKTEFLLILIGGVFVIEALSVIAQVISFRLFGRRILRMSPLHHHFELKGWSEWRVVITFWAAAVICAFSGVLVYSRQYNGQF